MQLNSYDSKSANIDKVILAQRHRVALQIRLSLKDLRIQSPPLLKAEAFPYQPQAVRGDGLGAPLTRRGPKP